jgi:hypothetical protein
MKSAEDVFQFLSDIQKKTEGLETPLQYWKSMMDFVNNSPSHFKTIFNDNKGEQPDLEGLDKAFDLFSELKAKIQEQIELYSK